MADSSKAHSDMVWFKAYMEDNPSQLRKNMLSDGWEWKCEECGIREWRGKKAPLQIDHINGDRSDCTRANLRFLCPNCHALTPTYVGRNKVSKVNSGIYTDDVIIDAYKVAKANVPNWRIFPTPHSVLTAMGKSNSSKSSWVRNRVIEVCESNDKPLDFSRNVRRIGVDKITWPNDEKLISMLQEDSRVTVAKRLGVSDTAVKRRCFVRGITDPRLRG